MPTLRSADPAFFRRSALLRAAFSVAAAAASSFGCAGGPRELPEPRRLVVHSGERLVASEEQMQEVDTWLREQMDSIRIDPSFLIDVEFDEGPVYPWEGLTINERADTARIRVQGTPGATPPYLIYAHLHLMAAQNRLDRWLPEVAGGNDFEVERAVLARVSDSWLYARTILGAYPYGLLDELVYSAHHGFLDAWLLTARPGAFVEARRAWLADNPTGPADYAEWFRKTFEREPPGLRGAPAARDFREPPSSSPSRRPLGRSPRLRS